MGYGTAAEATAIMATLLASTDRRRVAFAALSADDQLVCCNQASEDLDAVPWQGTPTTVGQPHAWPRVDHSGYAVTDATDPGAGSYGLGADWTTAGIPIEVRRAWAIQAAARALTALGQDDGQQLREMAASGVTSFGRSGKSVSIDQRIARTASAALDETARRYCQRLIRTSGELV